MLKPDEEAAAKRVQGAIEAESGTGAAATAAGPKEPKFYEAGNKLIVEFKVGENNTASIRGAGFAPKDTELKDMNLASITGGDSAATIASNLLITGATGVNIKKPLLTAGKPKRKSSKNRRKSKGGRKPKRKSSKNRK